MRNTVAKSLMKQSQEMTVNTPQFTRRLYRAAKKAYKELPWTQRSDFTVKRT